MDIWDLGLTDEGTDEEEEHEAGVSPEELVNGGVEDGYGGDDGGEDELGGEDAVDLAYEAPSQLIFAIAETRVQGPLLYVTLGAHALESEHPLSLSLSLSSAILLSLESG